MHGERHVALVVKYGPKPLWRPFHDLVGLDATGAVIALALHEAYRSGAPGVSYSRSKTYYTRAQRHTLLSYRRVLEAVATLERLGLIEHYKQPPGARGWQSYMRAKPELVRLVGDLLAQSPRLRPLMPTSPMILRDMDGIPVDLPRIRTIHRMTRKMDLVNEAVTAARVTGGNGANLSASMTRIFNISPDLSRGGRLYGMGTSWQNIPGKLRQHVTIDGEAIVELDFSTLHPAMLYAEADAPLPEDCYTVGRCSRWPRNLVKVAMMTLINARTRHAARLSIAHNEEMAAIAELGSQDAQRTADTLIDDIEREHQPIAGAFHRDAGARLMRRDSDLALSVMTSLLGQGIVALPVHDSFLVPASKRDQLEAAMLEAAHAIGLHRIRIKPAVPAA